MPIGRPTPVERTRPPAQTDGIVDAHIHVWSEDLQRYPLAPGFQPADMWHNSFTPGDHLARCDRIGPLRANLVQMTWYGLDHRYIIDLIADQPGRFAGTGIVPGVSDVSLPNPGAAAAAEFPGHMRLPGAR